MVLFGFMQYEKKQEPNRALKVIEILKKKGIYQGIRE
jgi:hypothetical protein